MVINATLEARPHAVVVGGGFAGAAAASRLAEEGIAVTLLEEKPTLGGRTTSLRDGVTKQDVDNGQHLFLGAYRDTKKFLRRLGIQDRLRFLHDLAVPMFSRAGGRSALRFGRRSGGFLTGILRYRELRMRDKLSLLYGLTKVRWARRPADPSITVSRWLAQLGQSAGARRAFWDPICYATLNERPDAASAAALAAVLREGFLGSSEERTLGHATLPLGKLWSVELAAYLRRQGGLVAPNQSAVGFDEQNGRVIAVRVADGTPVEADIFISALPMEAFAKLCPDSLRPAMDKLAGMAHAPIAAVNLWFERAPFSEPLIGFLDMDVHWAFNRERLWNVGARGQISIVFSAARGHAGRTSAELISIALADLRRAYPDFRDEPTHATVTWERQATPSPTPAFWAARPRTDTPLANLFLAGDWVDVGLPPTIEAACRSGHRAAESALSYLKTRRHVLA